MTSGESISLPGVNLEDARRRLVDDELFIVKLLGEFVHHGLQLEETLHIRPDGEGVNDALAKLHKLRGGAANLAAVRVADQAETMERELKEHRSQRTTIDLARFTTLRRGLRMELTELRDALVNIESPDVEPAPISGPATSVSPLSLPTPKRRRSKVLVIDDSDAMRSYLRVKLAQDMEEIDILEAAEGLAGYRILVEQKPDIVLCDLQMPNFDGMKLLQMRATRPELQEIPFIMLTAEHEVDRKVEVLNKGASDYVTKPFHGHELVARVNIHLRLKRLQDELQDANKRLEELATTDALTGLSNRRHFDKLLRGEIERTTRYTTPLSLIMLDVDHFKKVNDTYGHAMGDEVLHNLGELLSGSVRATDRVARIGGEELAIILPHTSREGALDLAERLRCQIEKLPHRLEEAETSVTASFGIASSIGNEASAAELLGRADHALYEAKTSGRNRVVTWDPSLHAHMLATGGQ